MRRKGQKKIKDGTKQLKRNQGKTIRHDREGARQRKWEIRHQKKKQSGGKNTDAEDRKERILIAPQ